MMNMLGFREALDHAARVRIQEHPALEIPVATPPGLALLQLIAWTNRVPDLRGKDAKDLLYLLKSHEEIPDARKTVYDYAEAMERYDWDIAPASAFFAGQACRHDRVRTNLCLYHGVNGAAGTQSMETLVEEMCEAVEQEFDRNKKLLSAYKGGVQRAH